MRIVANRYIAQQARPINPARGAHILAKLNGNPVKDPLNPSAHPLKYLKSKGIGEAEITKALGDYDRETVQRTALIIAEYGDRIRRLRNEQTNRLYPQHFPAMDYVAEFSNLAKLVYALGENGARELIVERRINPAVAIEALQRTYGKKVPLETLAQNA